MGTFESFRKAYGALKDSTTVGLAKDLDIAIVKATSHVEYPPKERHVRKIFYATSAHQPRADVAYCIHALSRRLSKTRNWIVAIKTLIVVHRILREGDPSFKEDLVKYSRKGNFLQISHFKDDSSPLAWDCSAWVRTYALFLEERLECYRILKYDVEFERLRKSPLILAKSPPNLRKSPSNLKKSPSGITKSSSGLIKTHSRTRTLTGDELLEQLPALQQLLYRLIGCQPEGSAFSNYLIQYALALFFDMPKYDAVKALHIYKRAGQQAENLADFYEYCKGLDLARNFQFPTLRQPPASFLTTMEEYIREAPSFRKQQESQESDQPPQKEEPEPKKPEEAEAKEVSKEELVDKDETQPKEEEVEVPPLISTDATDDLLGLNEINPKAQELEDSNAFALAIIQPGGNNSGNLAWTNINGTGWELALVTTPSNHTSQAPLDRKMAGGFDRLLLDSLYEDETARRQLQLQNAGYRYGEMDIHNQFQHYNQHDPFAMSNNIAPPSNVQMALMAQQQQQQMMFQQRQQDNIMVPYQYSQTQYPQQTPVMGSYNPFGDPFTVPSYPYNSLNHQGNYHLI
ncbi:hypothetical protein RJT34_32833 [Clitoria ternatea]|uniref:ENTH domain-containing protein n=1 Tax=Clitoria ternatea TaxID=43366 RepID=A0AAN9EWQ4_CLITE